MGKTPDVSIDQQPPAGGESPPLVRPYRRRHYRETPDGLVPYLPDGDPRHGTSNGYSGCKCKCDDCTRAKTAAHADYRARRRAADQVGAA
jgi:hypothetical protein